MKKLYAFIALMMMSLTANANSAAVATLSNFNLSTIYGSGFSSVPGSLAITLNSGASDNYFNTVYGYETGDTFPLFVESIVGDSSASASANASSISSYSLASNGYASSTSRTTIDYSYKANTLLYFSADAYLYGLTADIGSAFSYANIGLYAFDNVGSLSLYTNILSTLTNDTSVNNSYSTTKTLSFYFYDDEDLTIRVAATVDTNADSRFSASPVPETETYGMMICGIALLSLIRRRRVS